MEGIQDVLHLLLTLCNTSASVTSLYFHCWVAILCCQSLWALPFMESSGCNQMRINYSNAPWTFFVMAFIGICKWVWWRPSGFSWKTDKQGPCFVWNGCSFIYNWKVACTKCVVFAWLPWQPLAWSRGTPADGSSALPPCWYTASRLMLCAGLGPALGSDYPRSPGRWSERGKNRLQSITNITASFIHCWIKE